jgi:DNA modification methylase
MATSGLEGGKTTTQNAHYHREKCLCGARRIDQQIGLESSPDEYVAALVGVFREVRRVLRKDGTFWLNLGDSYNASPPGKVSGDAFATSGLAGVRSARVAREACASRPPRNFGSGIKPKDLIGIPWMVAFALRADGWYLRQDIIWSKPNPMPESTNDRCTKAHEYLFLMSRSERYWYDAEAIKEPISDSTIKRWGDVPDRKRLNGLPTHAYIPGENTCGASLEGRNKRSVWTVATAPYIEAHFATFPPALIEPCIKAGCPVGGTVLDPFGGAGTTGLVADRLQRNAVLIELNPAYVEMAKCRITDDAPLFAEIAA